MTYRSIIHDASWVWCGKLAAGPHQYVCFRKAFRIPAGRQSAKARFEISADSDFIVWLNGTEIVRGQFSDWPQCKTFTVYDVTRTVKPDANLLAVLVYYRGADFSEHCAGKPGLIAALNCGACKVLTDMTWRCRPHPAFRFGPMARVTNQMGFTTEFDARKDVAWQASGFDDAAWPRAIVQAGATTGFWRELLPRPVPLLNIQKPVPVALVVQGDFLRGAEADTVARTMAADALVTRRHWDVFLAPANFSKDYSPRCPTPTDFIRLPDDLWLTLKVPETGTTGRFFIIDCGREEVGLLTFRVDAPAGAILDIGYGEHLDDGRVRTAIFGRNFADRYICRGGDQTFTLPFRRLGARYLEVHVSNYRQPVRFNYIGLKPTEFPVTMTGAFRSSDTLADKIWLTGTRTLHLCMHEHYEDCPWREQSLYAFDSRNQALYGYYAFGNYDFAAASFDLLGRGYHSFDGFLELCAPARVGSSKDDTFIHINIPIFTLLWIVEVAEHWLYSGRSVLFDRFAERITEILARLERLRHAGTGLYQLPNVPGIWHFYEWEEGLAGKLGNEKPGDRMDAPFNLFLHEALGCCAWMLAQHGQHAAATVMRKRQAALGGAIRNAFWDPKRRLFASYLKSGRRQHYAELVQALVFKAGLATSAQSAAMLRALQRPGLVPMTLSTRLYQVLGLMSQGKAARQWVAKTIRDQWSRMVLAGATSFWETIMAGNDFDDAGSLCHGWSALPVYYYQAWVLGVRPLAPGFKRFIINPYPDYFAHAEGKIPTPAGPIAMRWERTLRGLMVEASGPAGLVPVVAAYPEAPLTQVIYNGRKQKTVVL